MTGPDLSAPHRGAPAGGGARDDPGALLVLRALGLGDAVTAIPALRGLRRMCPGRRLVLACRPVTGAWLRSLGLVDSVVAVDGLETAEGLSRWASGSSTHLAVNLHGKGPQSHSALLSTSPATLLAFARPELGVDGPDWSDDEHEVDRWCRLVRSAGGRCSREDLRLASSRSGVPYPGYVVVHPGAASPSRRWPAARFSAVVGHLVGRGRRVLVTGGAHEQDLAARVAGGRRGLQGADARKTGARDLSGRLTLGQLADVVAGAELVVSGDTGVAHLATAYAVPSVVLFGPTPPWTWGPAIDAHLHVVLWHGDDRPGAHHQGDAHGAALDPALAATTVDEVLESVDRLLTRS